MGGGTQCGVWGHKAACRDFAVIAQGVSLEAEVCSPLLTGLLFASFTDCCLSRM